MSKENIEAVYPLSPMQQGMLFHSLHAPQSGVYLQQFMCRLHESLQVFAFKQAWQHLIARHSILRTCFRWEGVNTPLQEVCGSVLLPWEEYDWRQVSAEEQARRLDAYLRADRQRSFQFAEAPLMRLALFRVATDDYCCVWTSHHALLDGRSRLILLQELFAVYAALCCGQDIQLASPQPYQEYIAWLEKQDWTRAETFWRHRLRGFTAPTPCVVDRVDHRRSDEESHGKQSLRLSEALTTGLQALAQQHQLTLNTLLQGAWAILLSRYSGEPDVVFGATRAGRRSVLKGAESIVGLLINTLPIRVHVAPDRLLLPWLQEIRTQWVTLQEYEHTPLVQVQQWSDIPPGKPLFESLLVFENYLLDTALQPQGESRAQREFQLLGATNYPLTVTGYFAQALLLEITYDQRRFDTATMTRMLGHLQTLLESMVTTPEQRLVDLPLLTAKERQQLLVDWNDTATAYPHDQCIHQVFEAQAEQTPDTVAVVCGDAQLTYRELNGRANQLAHFLRQQGVGPESLVGVCMERSLTLIIALLGVLKAGGAYVPVDPTAPQERSAFMLAETQAPVLLTQHHLLPRLPASSAQMVCVDTDWETLAHASAANPGSTVGAEHLAYVMYTSGSTGRPKGVSVRHRSVVRLVKDTNYASFTAADVFLQCAPVAFDASTFEIWGCLLNGARLVIFPAQAPSLAELGRALQRYQVTTLWLTAGFFHLMVEESLDSLHSVRQLLAGGDVLSVPHVQQVLHALPACRLINGYGPTENTTFTCCYAATEPERLGGSVPIGRPIANTQVYLLDPRLELVPIGVSGEVYIGGDGLARGYFNCPELTAEKFIPHPFSTTPGARLYRSGDVARYLSDGHIEFLGRLDHQVKIRGFRIELGEIETVLGQYPAVRETVLLAREDIPGDKRLVAYIVPEPGQTLQSSALRHFLTEKLPEYMVPSAFVMLEGFPLTHHGKIDRGALPVPDQARLEHEDTFVAPCTPIEEMLASIWADILGLERVGVRENFFALGGHSLLMTRVMSRVHQVFQVALPMQSLFAVPTVAGLARCIDSARGLHTSSLPLTARPHDLPLSFAQQRLWFLAQFEPESALYNISRSIRLRGPLSVDALQQALDAVVSRHEALRTTFAAVDGQPIQVIAAPGAIALPVIDLRPWPATEREAEAQRLCAQEAQRPFDLSADVMLRATLLRLDQEEHVLVLVMHHIASDGWSMGILFQELAVCYDAFVAGKSPGLPALPLQYADFAVWQRQWLQGGVLEAQLAYWKQQLENAPPVLDLPTDRPRPVSQSFHGARYAVLLPQALSKALKTLSQRTGGTLFMTLLAAFQVLLQRYTGQDDIVVGSPIANRTRVETEGMIGFFVNTLVLRTDLAGNPTFLELLARVRDVTLGAYAHQDLPFEKLVEALQPERDLHRTPLFQVFLNMVNVDAHALALHGLQGEPFSAPDAAPKFDVTLYVREHQAAIHLECVYNAELFCQERISEMLAQYHSLLSQVMEHPEQDIASYSLVTPASRQLLPDPGVALAEPPQEVVTSLFARWAQHQPQQVAVSQGDRAWTYGELATCADTLARTLVATGIAPGDVVAVYGRPSFGVIASMLGVLWSGGVLLLIDPHLPGPRQQLMLQQAAAKSLMYVVSEPQEAAWLAQQVALDVLHVDATTARPIYLDVAVELETIALPTMSPDAAAYIFFTSGSTGVPKGVLGCHKGLSHFLRWQGDTFHITPQDRVAQLIHLSFDPVLRDVFLPLTHGAILCIPEENDTQDPEDLLRWLERERISVLHTVPALAQSWLVHVSLDVSLRPLRWVFFAGEPLLDTLVHQWRTAFPYSSVVNLYGPTETTLVKCFYQVPDNLLPGIQPAGWPLPQTQALVLADNNRLCGIGEMGEIVLRTPFRSLGYINAPAEQRQQFMQNPFREDEGDVLYYTGDRGRYRPDGILEILGRGDEQVKVHGVRVELGEVTATLAQHPAVQACTVMAQKNDSGRTVLVAYMVAAAQHYVTTSVLRLYLSQHLPTAMVPTAFVFLDALPLLPNGKVDRRALPAPEPARLELEQAGSAPRTPVQEMVTEIWAAILGLERVGISDNFFALGGHSLLATQVISRIRKVLRVELPVRCLFETPTAAGLAAYIDTARQTASALHRPPLLPVTRNRAFPLSFAQQRLWFLDQLEPQSPLYNIPRAVRLHGPLHVEALQQALSAIVSRHEALRTTFVAVDGSPVQVIAEPCSVALSIIDLSACSAAEQEAEVQHLWAQEAQRPFDLTADVMLRASLFRLGAAEHILLLVLHHIAADGWSMGVLLQELSVFYDAFSAGTPPTLPELPIQYADFAVWQRQWLQGENLETQLIYWQQQLHNVPPVLELPTDRPRPAIQSCRGARQTVQLSKTLSQALKALSQRTGSTLFMTLLAAFKVLLQRYTGQDDIVVGSPIANRTQPEIEGLIGFFVNTLVLRTDLAGNPTFLEVLERVREVTLGAYAYQDLPFEKLVEELRPERAMSRSPLFQVMFILQNTPGQPLDLPGVTVTNLAVDSGLAKFDLTLSLSEAAEGLKGVVEYNTELFDADTITRLLGHLQILLEGIVAHPETPIAQLPLLTAAERQQLLVTWNATETTLPQVMGMHHLFEAQVEQTPDAVAVIADSGQLTYRELNQRANQLAHHLQALGVGPDVLVGLCMERSLELVIGLLGILKAGGAYVPLDPAYPQERLAFILRDARVPVLLTQQHILRRFPAHEAQVVCLDTDWEVIAQKPTAPPQSPVTAANLAYVIYTSGSTGTPKGVAITHWNAVALMDWARRQFAPEALAGVLASTSICFDLSVFELFVPLSCGGKVIVAENLLQLPRLSTVKDVILINTVPSVLTEFLRGHCLPPSVRTVNLAGEPLPTSLVQQIYQHNGIAQVYDLYGPSEDTTYSTCALRSRNGPATIGRPIANSQAYILDPCLTPVPVGMPGELYIGGAGLARGYLHRPELTAEKFLPNPFSDTPGARLYRTGDLARYLPDGTIAFLGRIDDQVKIRGFRIELGEVETVLSQHPAVREAVVMAREDVPGEKHLVAYVLANQEPGSATSMLRSFLKEKLPEYMVPSLFVILDAFPLTPNGKVDRRALPAPDTISAKLPGTIAPPRDSLELQLVQMWEEILHLHPIGVTENFFDLGGHSLLAVRLMAQIQRQFGQELPLAALFHGATIEDLACLLRQHTGSPPHSPLVCLQPAGTKRPFFCVHPAGGNVFCYVDLARHLGADQPLYGLQHPDLHGEQPVFTRLEEMAEHYIEVLRVHQPEGPYLLGGWSMGGMVAFEMAQQLVVQGQEVALLALLDTPARLSEAPPTDGDHAALLSRFAQDLGVFLDTHRVAQLTPEAQLAELLAQAQAAKAVTADVGLAQLRHHVQVFIHNVRAVRRYTPKAYSGRVTLLKARKQGMTQDQTLGWGGLAAGGVVCHTVPGQHYTMVREPHVRVLAQRLRECLEAVPLHPNNKA